MGIIMDQEADNLLIHIGYHKTGSSWLQNMLFTANNKIFEPLSIKDKGHSSLAKYFIYDEDGYCLSPFDFNQAKIREEIENIVSNQQKLDNKIPVISHERLSGNPHSGGFDAKKIAFMLNQTFPYAKILIVIREQKSFILSSYFQYLHKGGTHNLHKYLNKKYDGKIPYFSPSHIKYLPLIDEYRNLFGTNNVLILPYEMFRDEPLIFVTRIGDFLNTSLDIKEEVFDSKINVKSNELVMYYMRSLNHFRKSSSLNNYSPMSNKFTGKLANAFLKGTSLLYPAGLDTALKNRLKSQIENYVADRYIASNKEIGKLLDIDLSRYGYY